LVATALLIIYLLSLRWHIYLPGAVFWAALALMLGTILYQSLYTQLTPRYAIVVLLEIAVTGLAFHLIYQIPYYGITGSDAYMDMASVKGILSSGFVRGDPQYLNGTSYFPVIHVLGAQLRLITNIALFSVVKWFPSFLDIVLILLLYLFIRRIFNKERIALLSVLLFASLQNHVLFSSLFIRETIALVLALCCVYLYFSAKSSPHPVAYYALSIMSLVGTVFAHHLTSFMLLIFLLIHFLVSKAFELPFIRRTYFGDNIAGEKIHSSFLLIAFVTITTYWMYIEIGPLYNLISFTKALFISGQWGAASYGEVAGIATGLPYTFRGSVLFYGFYSFLLIFVIILLYGLLPRFRYHRIEALSFILFLFLCGIGGLMSFYVIARDILPNPDRFLMFGWLFGFAPLVAVILSIKNKWLIGIAAFLLLAFMLHNIYQIEPTFWDARAEGGRHATSQEDYALAHTFDFSSGGIAAYSINLMAIYDVHNNLGENAFSDIDLSEYKWVIVQKEVLRLQLTYGGPRTEAVSEMARLEKEGSPDRNKIYQSSNLSVFKVRE
jgi:hypothetical protein